MAQSIYSSDSTRKAILTSAVVNVSYFQSSTDALPENPETNALLFQYDTAAMLRWDGMQWLNRGEEMPVVGKIGVCSIRAIYDNITHSEPMIVAKTANGWELRSLDETAKILALVAEAFIAKKTRPVGDNQTETIDADMLDKYLPTIIGMGDALRFLAADSEHNPYWAEFPALLPDTDSIYTSMARRQGEWIPTSSALRMEVVNVDTMPIGQQTAVLLDGTLPSDIVSGDNFWVENYNLGDNLTTTNRMQTILAFESTSGRVQIYKRFALPSQTTAWTKLYDSAVTPQDKSQATWMIPHAVVPVGSVLYYETLTKIGSLGGNEPQMGDDVIIMEDAFTWGVGKVMNLTTKAISVIASPYAQKTMTQTTWRASSSAHPVGTIVNITGLTKIGTIGYETPQIGDDIILEIESATWGQGKITAILGDGVYTIVVTSSSKSILPTYPGADGDYILHVTMASGVPTLSWEVNS